MYVYIVAGDFIQNKITKPIKFKYYLHVWKLLHRFLENVFIIDTKDN